MKANLYYQLEVRDASGRRIRRTRRHRCHSFLGQMAQFMESIIGVRQVANVRNTANVLQTINDPGFITNQAMLVGTAGSPTRPNCIVVGTDATAVVGTDFNLGGFIGNGTGGGQLLFSLGTVANVSAGATSAEIVITRSFSNSSGGTITVREIGVRAFIPQLGTFFQIIRDVLLVAEVVGTGQVLTVVYTIKIEV